MLTSFQSTDPVPLRCCVEAEFDFMYYWHCQVAAQVHEGLRRFSPNGCVEKASYDDFYLDLTPRRGGTIDANQEKGTGPSLDNVTVIGGLAPSDVDDSLLKGVQVR